jgi:hypothetical protein
VRIEALSVSRLFAVAMLYVAGCPPLVVGARCAGRAVGGGEVGNWWVNWMVCALFVLAVLFCAGAVGAAAEWIVVRVVVRDRTEGAGDENVLSAPRPELTPHPIVAFVPWPDDGACEGAASECATSGSVDIVAAVDLLPIVGGGRPSWEDRTDCLL